MRQLAWFSCGGFVGALLDRSVFEKPKTATSFRSAGVVACICAAPLALLIFCRQVSAHGAGTKLGGHELTARINVLAVAKPDGALEQSIDALEDKRSKDEGNIFKQAGKS